MSEDQGGKAHAQGHDAARTLPAAEGLDASEHQGIECHGRELGQGIAPHIDIGQVIGGKGVGRRNGSRRQWRRR